MSIVLQQNWHSKLSVGIHYYHEKSTITVDMLDCNPCWNIPASGHKLNMVCEQNLSPLKFCSATSLTYKQLPKPISSVRQHFYLFPFFSKLAPFAALKEFHTTLVYQHEPSNHHEMVSNWTSDQVPQIDIYCACRRASAACGKMSRRYRPNTPPVSACIKVLWQWMNSIYRIKISGIHKTSH